MKIKEVIPVPPMFGKYTGYNDTKRKKLKELPMSAQQLDSHSQAIYSILLKPVVNSTAQWKVAAEEYGILQIV